LLQQKYEEVTEEAKSLNEKLQMISSERDELASKMSSLQKEKEALISKVNDVSVSGLPEVAASNLTEPNTSDYSPTMSPQINSDDEYWASSLREKASLQLKMDSLKQKLSQDAIEIVELKQANADLQIEVDSMNHKRDELDREIKHKEDLINSLSLELARTKNDTKFVSDRLDKMDKENSDLRMQIKELFTTKSGLEKTIVQLQQEKKAFERRISETDSVIQIKIDESWEIKESLDRTFKSTSLRPSSSQGVDLEPILVQSPGEGSSSITEITNQESNMLPGFNGKVVSINEENNFVIVDLGEKSGLRLGDVLSVYRDSKYIARLEVIQVRKDISAADIKEKWSNIVVGDTIK